MKAMCRCNQLDCRRYGCLRERGPIPTGTPKSLAEKTSVELRKAA